MSSQSTKAIDFFTLGLHVSDALANRMAKPHLRNEIELSDTPMPLGGKPAIPVQNRSSAGVNIRHTGHDPRTALCLECTQMTVDEEAFP